MNCTKKPNAVELQSILLHGAKPVIDMKKVSATSVHYDDEANENFLRLQPSSEGVPNKADSASYLNVHVSMRPMWRKENVQKKSSQLLKVNENEQ